MHWRMKVALAAAVVSFAALDTAQVSHAAPLPDACSLLTAVQVTDALGIAVKAGTPSPFDSSLCDWPPPGPSNTKEVEVSISDTTNWSLIKGPSGAAGEERTPVSGLGEDALYLKTAGQTMLYVKKGKVEFYVRVHGFPPDQVKVKEKALAQDILAKL
jgi:hypothetical protein